MKEAVGLTITLRCSDILDVSEGARERTFINPETVVVEFVIPFMRRGDLDQLMLLLSKMAQRDTSLATSKRSSHDQMIPGCWDVILNSTECPDTMVD